MNISLENENQINYQYKSVKSRLLKIKVNSKFYAYTALFLFTLVFSSIANKTLATAPILSVQIPKKVEETVSLFSNLVNQQYSSPHSITIEKLGVISNVEIVGIEQDGTMQTPVNFANVGWLQTSSRAGQQGNLVISGHYDYPGGAAAVFYNLDNLQVDDVVKVNYLQNNGSIVSQEYRITSKYMADPSNQDHIEQAFRETKVPTITLITCNGIWDSIKKEYSHRIVVQGEMVVNNPIKKTPQFIKNQFSN